MVDVIVSLENRPVFPPGRAGKDGKVYGTHAIDAVIAGRAPPDESAHGLGSVGPGAPESGNRKCGRRCGRCRGPSSQGRGGGGGLEL